MKDLGYTEGRDLFIDARWAEDRPEQLQRLALDVASRKPQVIVTASSAGVAAVMKATSSIPVVFATAGRPVEQGFAASLQHPGGNVTGVALYSALSLKIVEFVREALPGAKRLAVMVHERDQAYRQEIEGFEENARRLRFEPQVVRVAAANDFDRAFAELASRKADALILPQLVLFQSHAAELARRAIKGRMALFSAHDDAAAGALLSYGTPREENYRRSASLVDKILRGASPGDLPIEQPDRVRLAVNQRTARAIGVKLPQVILVRADEVIE